MIRVVGIAVLAVLLSTPAGTALSVPSESPAPSVEIPTDDAPVGPQPCTPGAGCMPIYVDETGDRMTGALEMFESWINFPDSRDGLCLGCIGPQQDAQTFGPMLVTNESTITGDLALLNMPINITNIVSLLDGSKLNATAGGTIFIDFFGNLTFADGSWMNNDGAFLNHTTVFNQSVFVQGNGSQLVVANGAELVFNNAGGILTTEGVGRVGTIDNNPFRIIVNNETALLLIPGSSPNLVGGYNGNNASAGLIGIVIAGGGQAGAPNTATANFTAILGGSGNTAAGNHATAAGQDAGALHDGTFVWADGTGIPFNSTGNDQFLVRASGGVGINTDSPVSALTVEGDITPATDDAHALGSATHRWDQLFMASEIDYASNLLYTNNGITRMTLTTGGSLSVTGDLNAAGNVTGTFFGDGSSLTGVVATDLADASVTPAKIADGAVTSGKIGAAAVTGSNLASGAVTNGALASNAVTTAKIQNGAVDSTKLAAGAVTNNALAVGAVTGTKIGLDAVTADKIASGAVGTNELASGAVTPAKMAACATDQILKHDGTTWACATDGGETYTAGDGLDLIGSTFHVANEGITSPKIANGTITAADINASQIQVRIGDTCVPGSFITGINPDGTVVCATDGDTTYSAGDGLQLAGTTFSIADLAVTAGKIASGAVTSAKIASGAVGATHLADLAVTNGKIANGAVTSAKIATGAVGTTQLADLGVTSGDLADLAVTNGKLATGAVSSAKILDGTITSADVDPNQIQARIGAACPAGSSIRAVDLMGGVTCETDTDTDTTYSAGIGLDLTGTTFSLADLAVTGAKLAADAVTTDKVLDGTLTAADINASQVQVRIGGTCPAGSSIRAVDLMGGVTCETDTDTTYAAGTGLVLVDETFHIPENGISNGLLAPDAVSSSNIIDGAVTTADIADLTITATDIATGAVTSAKILDGTIVSADIADGTIAAADLATGAVTSAKILDGTIVSADIDSSQIQRRVAGTCGAGQAIGTISSTGTVTCNTLTDAQTLDGFDSGQFLRSDASDTFTAGTLTIGSGAQLDVAGTVSSDIIPTANATYQIGDNTHRYTDLYLASKVHFMTGMQFLDGDNEVMMNLTGNSLSVYDTIETGEFRAWGGALSLLGPQGTIEFVDGTESIGWSSSFQDFQMTDDLRVQGNTLTERLGAGTDPSNSWRIAADEVGSTGGTGAIKGSGVFGPTNGYLGAQGNTDFDGITSADWSGRELGVVGISTGASATDNWGVVGHSNGAGVRGEHSGNPGVDYAELGRSGVGIQASGSSLAGEFIGDVDIDGALSVDSSITIGGTEVCADCAGTRGTFGSQTIIGPFDAEAGRQRIQERSAGVSVCYHDADSNGFYNAGDGVYINVDQDNCADAVESGDVRIVPNGAFSTYSRVLFFHSDAGLTLNAGTAGTAQGIQDGQRAAKWYDINSNARFDQGDALYLDMDNSGLVSPLDVRLSASGGFAAGSVVQGGNSDINNTLRNPLATNFDFIFSWWDLDWDGVLDTNEPLYLDMDDDERTSGGDFRIDSIASLV